LFGERNASSGTVSSTGHGSSEKAPPLEAFAALWRGDMASEAASDVLSAAGFDDPAGLLARLERIRRGQRYLQLPAISRQRVDALLPQLLHVASTQQESVADAQTLFERLLDLLEAVSRRSAYLALLIEHPPM